MADKGPVIVTLSCEANPGTDTEEIDRAEWEAMTPAQRRDMLGEMAINHMNNQGGCGWWIDDPADAADTEGGDDTPAAPDPLRCGAEGWEPADETEG